MKKEKIAIIGAGVSGLTAANLLHKKYEVTVLEKNNRFGGHAYAYRVNEKDQFFDIDLGFMVFNEKTYPNFINLLKQLNVEYEKSCMSFAISRDNFEYAGTNLQSLFPSSKNLLNFDFIYMLYEIIKFNRIANSIASKNQHNKQMSLKQFLNYHKFSVFFQQNYILPMAAAIWSSDIDRISNFDFLSFVKFFKNHGLLQIFNRPQWYNIKAKSNAYVNKILSKKFTKKSGVKIEKVEIKTKTIIYEDNSSEKFDKIIFATPANQTLKLAHDLPDKHKKYLQEFSYVKNIAYLHNDPSYMPINKKVWASWCCLEREKNFFITYWLNNIQNLKTKNNYFLSLNIKHMAEKNIIKKIYFYHPSFNKKTVEAQKKLNLVQGENNVFYCGSYLGYGFHEDGVNSALYVSEILEKTV